MGQNQSQHADVSEVVEKDTESRKIVADAQGPAYSTALGPTQANRTEIVKTASASASLAPPAVSVSADDIDIDIDMHMHNNTDQDEQDESIDFTALSPQIKFIKDEDSSRTDNPNNRPVANSNKKKCSWFPWKKKKKEPKEIVTTGITMKLDETHNMLLFLPEKRKASMQRKNERRVRRAFNIELENENARSTTLHDAGQDAKTKLIVKDVDEMKDIISMRTRGRRDGFVDSAIVSGVQIFVTRYNPEMEASNVGAESAPQSRAVRNNVPLVAGGFVSKSTLGGMNVLKPTTLDEEHLDGLLKVCREKLGVDRNKVNLKHPESASEKEDSLKEVKDGQVVTTQQVYDLSGHPKRFAKVCSAVVPRGIGKQLFTPERVMNTSIKAGMYGAD